MVLFHKFYLLSSATISSPSQARLIAAACLFISIKANNGFFSVADIVDKASKIDENLVNSSCEMVEYEIRILINIGFELEVVLPYKGLEHLFEYLKTVLKEKFRPFLQTCSNFINDSFKFPLCLYYRPNSVALTSVYLTAKLYNIILPDVSEVKWYNIKDQSIMFEEIEEISNLMQYMYTIITQPVKDQKTKGGQKLLKKKRLSASKCKK